ncbi:DUF2855 family protein [Erythrobacter sp. HL-111]|uniref:DUF2855 family protein n=1 Tax=Erythrobacter sp. HL-111 TaxID=1798193 RepID=UPI0006DA42F6|nr:DUF2855 family protein [Erythrobacter sp. HL-111]KPP95088.1 MAG: Protein of unknown function (DUF2855) [Erythrobacteraceae bacterium HL-111]SDS07607.1 Protein of unknown function [Erythrobacter sp. HL-111]
MTIQQIQVRKDALERAELVHVEPMGLADGAVRLAVESFSVTANNVTYAVVGDGFKYWDFFPAPAPYGIVPMWGHARVAKSRHPEIEVGERVYGYLPMGTSLDVVPGKVSASGFTDMSEHRQPMSPVYNQYSRLAADPEHDPAREAERMIFGPLFRTGFLIADFMKREDWFGAQAVLLTSASSKTAMALASAARAGSPEVRRIGLTSRGNVDFVARTGLYDEVVAYDAVEEIEPRPAVVVDFAGDADLLGRVHRHFADALRYSCLVGATHREARSAFAEGGEQAPGPKPKLFFAPDHMIAFARDHGREQASRLVAQAWHRFLGEVEGAVEIDRRKGLAAAREVWLEMVAGKVDPARGIVIEP